jgi:hypothetical protein
MSLLNGTPINSTAETLPIEEQIRQRAYELYLERGGESGSELEDWCEAEREIQSSPDYASSATAG